MTSFDIKHMTYYYKQHGPAQGYFKNICTLMDCDTNELKHSSDMSISLIHHSEMQIRKVT